MLIIGGYSQEGPLSSVELLDIKSGRRMRFLSGNVLLLTQFFSLTYLGRWEKLPDLPQPRYGHACLLMELAGQEGVLVIIHENMNDLIYLDKKLSSFIHYSKT